MRCVDRATLKTIKVILFDGLNWEASREAELSGKILESQRPRIINCADDSSWLGTIL